MNDELLEAAKPLIKYLAENHQPDATALVTSFSVGLFKGMEFHHTGEFLED